MKALFSLFRGIETEKSDINSTPESLIDCKNVLLTKDGFISSRHGHPQVYFPAANYISSASNITAESLFRFKASDSAYKTGIIIKDSSNGLIQVAKYSGSGDLASGDTYTGPIDVATLVNPTAKSKTVQQLVRTFNHDENTYYLTEYGLTYGSDVLTMKNNKGIIFPVVNTITYQNLQSTVLPDNNWLKVRSKISVKVIFELEVNDSITNSRVIQSPPSPSREVVYVQMSTSSSPISELSYVNLIISISNVLTIAAPQNMKMKVYRTLSYQFNEPAPVEYFQCFEQDYSTLTGTNNTTIALTINDDGILSQERLYTDPNNDGDAFQNFFPMPARDVINFKNYFLYSDYIKPTIFEVSMTGLPASGETFSLAIARHGYAAHFPVTTTFNAGSIDANITTYAGLSVGPYATDIISSTYDGFSTPALSVRIKPGTTAGEVSAYAKTAVDVLLDVSTGNVRNVIVTPQAGLFDLNKFDAPGFLAIVSGAANTDIGKVRYLLQYKSVTEVTNNGTIEFEGCVSIGNTFPASTTLLATAAGPYYLYYLPGQSAESLPLYTGDENSTTGFFSLLPATYKIPEPIAIPLRVASGASALAGWDVSGSFVVTYVKYLGILKKSPAQLIDNTTINLVNSLNIGMNTYFAGTYNRTVYARKQSELGKFTIEMHTLSYEHLYLSVSNVSKWSPALSVTSSIVASPEECKNGIYISRQNNPESIPLASVLAPILVGRSDRRILKMVANSEFVYVFKENEGVFQVVISEGGTFANVQQVQNIDKTIHLIASESVQVVDESIFFLSHKGFRRIAGNQILNIGDMVDTEVRRHLAKLSQNNKLNSVRSYANESKGYYCCYLPGVNSDGSGISYVYNLRRGTWSKFDKEFDSAVVDEKGLVTSLCTDYTYSTVPTTDAGILDAVVSSTKTWQYLRSDVYTSGDPDAASDKYDDSFIMTNYTFPAASASSRIRIQSVGNADPTDNLINILYRLKGKKLWYVTNAGVKYPLSIVASSGTFNSVGTTYLECTFDGYTAPPITPSVSDSLVIGVNVSLEMKAFVGTSPDALSHFSKISVHTNSSIYKMSCSFRTDTQASYTTPSFWSDQIANRSVYVATVGLMACRGRFLNLKLTHTTPKELMSITALAYEYNEGGKNIQKDQ